MQAHYMRRGVALTVSTCLIIAKRSSFIFVCVYTATDDPALDPPSVSTGSPSQEPHDYL